MDKIKEKLLEEFKKSNASRKEKLAAKYGFVSADDYLHYLNGYIVEKVEEETKELPIPTIHNVIILDGSGSMGGSKFKNSVAGIKKELQYMLDDKTINWTSTIYKFSDTKSNTSNPHFLNSVFTKDVDLGRANGGTPLYKTIIEMVEQLLPKVGKDKVLIKIYTDGQDTDGGRYFGECKSIIKGLDKSQFTVTFVGTKYDVANIIETLELDESNTLVIENSGKGFEEAFTRSMTATAIYATKVVRGEDVSTGFYLEML